MCKFLKKINYLDILFNIIFYGVLFFTSYLIIITLCDLSKYKFDPFSKDSISFFLNSFYWCKDYISSSFVLYTIYYALKTYKINNENKLFSNIIEPNIRLFYSRIAMIKKENLRMHDHFDHNGRDIITRILVDTEGTLIENKDQLTKYFDIFIKPHITTFEMCGYSCHQCNYNVCNEIQCINTVTYNSFRSHSLSSFKIFAHELLCISHKYSDFENDLEYMYLANIEQLRALNSPTFTNIN